MTLEVSYLLYLSISNKKLTFIRFLIFFCWIWRTFFPLCKNHPEIIYLDNAASTQKPQLVIDAMSDFMANEYANIHRGLYGLSEASEQHYHESKRLVAELLWCSTKEVIYSYNTTYAINLLAQAMVKSKFLQKGDVVLLGMRDHHANVLPWMNLAEMIGFEVQFVATDENYQIDWNDFDQKYTEKVKVVAMGQVSNVTGAIYDLKKIRSKIRPETFFLIDGSQSVPNMIVDMEDLGADAVVFTAHKIMASTGLGVLALKNHWIKEWTPLILWGGTIKDVSVSSFSLQNNAEKREAGTPNIIGAVSLEASLNFIKGLGEDWRLRSGIAKIWLHEQELTNYALERFIQLQDKVNLIGPKEQRVSLFSFTLKDKANFNQIGEFFAEKNICIRCGGHCAYPLHKHYHLGGTCRMSAYLNNDISDLEKFFARLEELVKS